ncbi:MAG: gluconate 2-dehydrogenase subunit 3 family protein [Chitinispirillaceae bacterium]|nr:gluconate 2-dehydrogenase subunit 3 family protein [Chitinispirillaceae bacterium]
MKKRTFLGLLASAALFRLFIPPRKVQALFNHLKTPVLTDHEIASASIIAEHIYPADDEPGARSLGIETFILTQCRSGYFRTYVHAIKKLTSFLDNHAQKNGARDFIAMNARSQAHALHMAAANNTIVPPRISEAWNALVDMTITGCFAAPMHGGNRHAQAWRLMGDSLDKEWFDA